jgi:hypothetical protein
MFVVAGRGVGEVVISGLLGILIVSLFPGFVGLMLGITVGGSVGLLVYVAVGLGDIVGVDV